MNDKKATIFSIAQDLEVSYGISRENSMQMAEEIWNETRQISDVIQKAKYRLYQEIENRKKSKAAERIGKNEKA